MFSRRRLIGAGCCLCKTVQPITQIATPPWQLLDHLRADPTTAEIAVLVCSADIDMLTQRTDELRQHGASILLKPFAIDDLLARVHQLLDRHAP